MGRWRMTPSRRSSSRRKRAKKLTGLKNRVPPALSVNGRRWAARAHSVAPGRSSRSSRPDGHVPRPGSPGTPSRLSVVRPIRGSTSAQILAALDTFTKFGRLKCRAEAGLRARTSIRRVVRRCPRQAAACLAMLPGSTAPRRRGTGRPRRHGSDLAVHLQRHRQHVSVRSPVLHGLAALAAARRDRPP